MEIQIVDEVFDEQVAGVFGIFGKGQITVMIHTGSRGFGHQVCQDNLDSMQRAMQRYGIVLPDRQLACAPVTSREGQEYLGAMTCAANFAWANRQAIAHWVRESFEHVMGAGAHKLGMRQVYDVAHNMAKIEEHEIEGKLTRLCVHRKGATRAFGPGNPAIPKQYRAGRPARDRAGRHGQIFVPAGGNAGRNEADLGLDLPRGRARDEPPRGHKENAGQGCAGRTCRAGNIWLRQEAARPCPKKRLMLTRMWRK